MQSPLERLSGIITDLESLNLELNRQCLSVRRGLEKVQRTGPIFADHPLATSLSSISTLKKLLDEDYEDEIREQVARLYFTCIGHFIKLDLLMMEETLDQFLVRVRIPVPGGELPVLEIVQWLAMQDDFTQRERLERQARPIIAKASEIRAHIWQGTLKILKEDFGFPDYLDYCSLKKGFDLNTKVERWKVFLKATDQVYFKALSSWIENELGGEHASLSRCHLIHILHKDPVKRTFSNGDLIDVLERTLDGLGLKDTLGSRLFIDMEHREGKSPLSRCVPLRVPQDIHITIKPMGLLSDFDALLHEVGHGLHFSHADASLPYPFRHLPRSYALTECYGFLLQNLLEEPGWLSRHLGLKGLEMEAFLSSKWLKRLCIIRRHIGKFLFEYDYFSKGEVFNWAPYAKAMEQATGFLYDHAGALLDMEEEFYSLDYLEAWAADAVLKRFLKENFGEDWFENLKAGTFLKWLWSHGDRWGVDGMLQSIGCTSEDLSTLLDGLLQPPFCLS
jgi:hypothetical protein